MPVAEGVGEIGWRPSCSASRKNFVDPGRTPSIASTRTNALVSIAIGIAGSGTRCEVAELQLLVIVACSLVLRPPYVARRPGICMCQSRVTETRKRSPVILATAPRTLMSRLQRGRFPKPILNSEARL